MTKNRRPLVAAVALAVVCSPAMATDTIEGRDKFELWNGCAPVAAVVGLDDDIAVETGLTKERLETTVRSRLRAARIYKDEVKSNEPVVFVHLDAHGCAATGEVGFYKFLWDMDPEVAAVGIAMTWNRGFVGTHQGGTTHIIGRFGEIVDEFIDEYLRINDQAC